MFIENKDNPYKIYNNYIKLSIVFHPMIKQISPSNNDLKPTLLNTISTSERLSLLLIGSQSYVCTAVSGQGHFQDFRPGFRFWHICHVDHHGHFTLKQLRLPVPNETHIQTPIQVLNYSQLTILEFLNFFYLILAIFPPSFTFIKELFSKTLFFRSMIYVLYVHFTG